MASFARGDGSPGHTHVSFPRPAPPELIELALERVLSSYTLRSSPRLRRFLAHVVRHALAGDDDSLKEYALGIDVFDRGVRFDPRGDAIVRVEARRLRDKLHRYYHSEGATDPVTISIPEGAYRPIFQLHENPPAALLDDADALCCQAGALVLRSSPDAIARARRYLRLALERWPTCPELHVMLASATLTGVLMGVVAPSEGMPLVRASARRALRLDARVGDAHLYAAIPDIVRVNKSAALKGARRALRLAPANAMTHYWAAAAFAAALRMRDMLTHIEMAVRLEPSALSFRTWRAVSLFWAGDIDVALRHLRDIVAFEPRDLLANHWLGHIAAAAGRYEEAREAAARACDVAGSTMALGGLGWVEAMSGSVEAAESILETLHHRANGEYVARSGLAAIYVALGRLPQAAQSLEAARREGDMGLAFARGDLRWEPVRGVLGGL